MGLNDTYICVRSNILLTSLCLLLAKLTLWLSRMKSKEKDMLLLVIPENQPPLLMHDMGVAEVVASTLHHDVKFEWNN